MGILTFTAATSNLESINPPTDLQPHFAPTRVFPLAPPPPLPQTADALIISDLHLGSDNCQAKALHALLASILDGSIPARRLIINGDVFDSIDFRRLKKNHWKVLSTIRHLSDKIEVIWTVGNHDGSADIISNLLGITVKDQHILESSGQRLLVLHGHRFDEFIDDHPLVTWLGDCIYALLQRIDRTHYVARLAKRKTKIFVHCLQKIERGATAHARFLHCHGVICGHTHHPIIKLSPDGIHYYNAGCWTEKPCSYLTVLQGHVSLHHFQIPEESPTDPTPLAPPAQLAATI